MKQQVWQTVHAATGVLEIDDPAARLEDAEDTNALTISRESQHGSKSEPQSRTANGIQATRIKIVERNPGNPPVPKAMFNGMVVFA